METQELEKLQSSANGTDNSKLMEYKTIDKTPFTIASVEKEKSDEKEHYVLFGKYQLSNKYATIEEAEKEANTMDWFKIMGIAHAIAEQVYKMKEIEKLSKKQ